MPQAGQSMEEGTIVKWRVQPGAQIRQGEIIFEVETDKAVVEVEAVEAGRLARIVVPEGGTIGVKQPVAFLADTDAAVEAYLASAERFAGSAPTEAGRACPDESGRAASPASGLSHHPLSNHTPQPSSQAVEIPDPQATTTAPSVPTVPQASGARVKVSPAARKIASQRGIDLNLLKSGRGPGGRILSTDLPGPELVSPAPTTPAAAAGIVRKKLSKMRRAIAANLQASKQTIPHFYARMTFDATPMLAFYGQEKAKYACSLNDIITAACARVLREFPAFRQQIQAEELIELPGVNVGIAVSLDDGLTVPVLIGADRMSLEQVARNTGRIVEAARAGRLEGVGEGVFTITNLGMYGVEEFAAIINPPEAAILAVGAVREAMVVTEGVARPGHVLTVTLSCDHRIIDGVMAAKFLARLREILETPASLSHEPPGRYTPERPLGL